MIGQKIHDVDGLRPALRRLQELTGNLSPVMQDLGEYMVAATRKRFQEGRGPDGQAWAAKSPVTMQAVRERGDRPDPRPLIGVTKRLGREIHYRAARDSVSIGSSLIYSAVQQLGAAKGQFGRTKRGPIPWGNIPARPFLGVGRRDGEMLLDIVQEALERAEHG